MSEARQRRILAQLNCRLSPERLGLCRNAFLTFVAASMLVFAAAYGLLLAGALFGLWCFMAHVADLWSTQAASVGLFACTGLGLVAFVCVLLFSKPLWASFPASPTPLSLSRNQQELLFEVVDRLCDALGTPRPDRIDVDCHARVDAGYHNDGGVFDGGRVLTIGLPLVANLELRDFLGLIVHELAHYTQAPGSHRRLLVHLIHNWLRRRVRDRDLFDDKLAEACVQGSVPVVLAAYVARGVVWTSRLVLGALLGLAQLVSHKLLRSAEYRADRYWMRLAGTQSIESALRRMHLLHAASEWAESSLSAALAERKLALDICEIIARESEQIPRDVKQEIDSEIDLEPSPLCSIQPRAIDRIRTAACRDETGCLLEAGPASAVFADFEDLCRSATYHYYWTVFGDFIRRENLVAAEELLGERDPFPEESDALVRYFQDTIGHLRPLALRVAGLDDDFGDPKAILASLNRLRTTLVAHHRVYEDALEEYAVALCRVTNAELAADFEAADIIVDARAFGMDEGELSTAQQQIRPTVERLKRLDRSLERFEKGFRRRLMRSLALLRTDATDDLEGRDQLAELTTRLLAAAESYYELSGKISQLRMQINKLDCLFSSKDVCNNEERIGLLVYESSRDVRGHLTDLLSRLAGCPSPFDGSGASMADFVLPDRLVAEEPSDVLNVAQKIVTNLHHLYDRILGNLALIAEEIEASVGLDPLTIPVHRR